MKKETMNNMTSFRKYRHALIPFFYGIFYLVCFFLLENRSVTAYHMLDRPIDHKIPFCEFFVIPYYIWYLYMLVTVIFFVLDDRKDFYKLCFTLGIGMTLFLIVSLIYPNAIQIRPDSFSRDNFCVTLVKAMYFADTSTNVLPSIHCFNSLACHAAISHNQNLRRHKWVLILSLATCVLIILSTIFIKQHSLIDLFAAIILFILLYIPAYKL